MSSPSPGGSPPLLSLRPPRGVARPLQKRAPPYPLARPNNILEWHFVITGPKDSVYEGGQYHGKLVFPPEYPYKPPAIMMLTPKCRARRGRPRPCPGAELAHPCSAVGASTPIRACASR